MIPAYKKFILGLILIVAFISSVLNAHGQTIGVLDQWVASTSPSASVTQRTFGKPIRITGAGTGCVQLDTNGFLSASGSCGGSGFLTNTGSNTFLNTGSVLQFPSFAATSSTATSSIAGPLWVNTITGSTSALTITTSNANQASNIVISPGNGVGIGSDGGGLYLLGSLSNGTLSGSGQVGLISPDSRLPADVVVSAGTSTNGNANIQFGTNGSYLYNGSLTQIKTPQMTIAANGNVGINNTSPSALFQIHNSLSTSASDFLVENANYVDGLLEVNGTSRQVSVGDINQDHNGTALVANDSLKTIVLQAKSGLTFFTDATTTFPAFAGTAHGINLTGGCYALNGTCISGGGGGGTVSSGIAGQFPYYAANGTTLTATSTLTIGTTTGDIGNIGIGTTSPAVLLDVSGVTPAVNGAGVFTRVTDRFQGRSIAIGLTRFIGTSFPGIWLNQVAPDTTNYAFLGDPNVGDTYFNAPAGSKIQFRIGNITPPSAMTIASTFNVGINDDTPSALLSLGTSLSNTKIALYDNGSGSTYGFGIQGSNFISHVSVSGDNFNWYDSTALTNDIMTLKGTGKLGLSNTSPTNTISLGATTDRIISTPGTDLTLQQTGDTFGTSALTLEDRNGSAGALFSTPSLDLVDFGFQGSSGVQQNIRYEHRSAQTISPLNSSVGEFQFINAPTGSATFYFASGLNATVINSGNLGIGTTSPYATLSVKGVAGTVPFTVASSTDAILFSITSAGHIQTGGASPTVSSCGSSPSITGNDERGTISPGTGVVNSCVVTFSKAYATAPICLANAVAAGAVVTAADASASTVQLTISFAASVGSGGSATYICLQ